MGARGWSWAGLGCEESWTSAFVLLVYITFLLGDFYTLLS